MTSTRLSFTMRKIARPCDASLHWARGRGEAGPCPMRFGGQAKWNKREARWGATRPVLLKIAKDLSGAIHRLCGGAFFRARSDMPVGEPLTGTGRSPVPPILQTNSYCF